MRSCEPKIFLIGDTRFTNDGFDINAFFAHKEKTTGMNKPPIDWKPTSDTDVEKIIEFYGRLCYESWDAESTSNNNITRIRNNSKDYLLNILKSGHGSVLEHAWLNFIFSDVSRIFTHELVRHRVGVAISELSHRFYRNNDRTNRYGMPLVQEQIDLFEKDASVSLTESNDILHIFEHYTDVIHENSINLAKGVFDINSLPFAQKKKITSLLRRLAPSGMATDIGWSTNIRSLRHIIESRTNRHSEYEIRKVFAEVAEMVQQKYPLLFGDYKCELIDGINEFSTDYPKV